VEAYHFRILDPYDSWINLHNNSNLKYGLKSKNSYNCSTCAHSVFTYSQIHTYADGGR